MKYFSIENGALVYRNAGEELRLLPWGANSLRVMARVQQPIEQPDWALLPPEVCEAEITCGERQAEIRNGQICAGLEVNGGGQCRVTYRKASGEVLLREIGDGGALHLMARRFSPLPGGDFALSVSFDGLDERLYGLGQYQTDQMNLKYGVFELAQRNSQASVPFVMSSRGYGFLWHNPAIGEVTFGKNRTVWKAESTKQMDYWITTGEDFHAISLQYARATGFAPMMPDYALGFWQCKLRYWNQEQLLEVAREYKRRGVPLSVIVCDFFHWPKMGDFRFDEEFFPNPGEMVRELKDMGVELMVSVWPQVDLGSENYAEMRQQGLLIRAEQGEQIGMRFGGDSMMFDATNPRARQYVWEKCKKNYGDFGIRLFWLDEAEPEYGSYDFGNYRYYLGSNLQVGNVYPQRFSRGFYEGRRESGDTEIVNLVRCAWAGSQRYGALVWSGDIASDWETFRRQVKAGLNMGIAGIPWWTTDIGGFIGGNPDSEAFRELLARWFAWGAFCPVMRLHGDRLPMTLLKRADGRPNLHTGGNNEIWSFGAEMEEILKGFIFLREAMKPYIRKLMEEAHTCGAPVMRTLFYEFPEDSRAWEIEDEYLFGADVLVAPVMEAGAVEKDVYLPAGVHWTHVFTGVDYEGGQTVRVSAPLSTIPAFWRNGVKRW